jgi:hypothetical protein
VAVTAGAGLLAGATSAFASDQLNINVNEGDLTLPRGLIGPAGTKDLHIGVAHDGDGHVPSATLTVDATHLAGIADVAWPAGCTHSGAVGTCTIDHVDDVNQTGPAHVLALPLTAAAGAKDGDQGTLELTASAPGVESTESSADISVGSGADLVLQPFTPVKDAKVGSTVTAPIRWSNTGNQTAPSTEVTLQTMAGLDFTQRYSNCLYTKPSGSLKRVTATCALDGPLPPGGALELSPPVKMRVTKEAWITGLAVRVQPPGAQPDPTGSGAAPTPGNGPRLTATPVPLTRTTADTAVINPRDSEAELGVQADNHAHYSAIGADARGDQGSTVPITVGMRNSGPALIFDRSGGENIDALKVTLPQGTTVTKVPAGCEVLDTGKKGHGPYLCVEPDSVVQAPGYHAGFTFDVHLDQQLSDAHGSAVLAYPDGPRAGEPAAMFPWDTSTDGYTAPIVLNAPETAPPSSAPAGTGPTNAPGADGQSQTLAATGGGSHTPLIVGAAAAALLAGAGALTFSRRRGTAGGH